MGDKIKPVLKVTDITQEIINDMYPEIKDCNIGCEYVPPSEEEEEFFKNNIEPRDYEDYPPKIADAYFRLQTIVDSLNEGDDILKKYKDKLTNINGLDDTEIQKLIDDMEYDIADLAPILDTSE